VQRLVDAALVVVTVIIPLQLLDLLEKVTHVSFLL
jgi:hypothetical protein